MSSWVLFAAVLLLDQASKALTKIYFPERVVANSGFFERPEFFILVLVVFVLLYRRFFSAKAADKTGFTLILAGAVSNLFDKLLYGSVVDFLNLGIATFNVADLSIWVGILVLGYNVFMKNPNNKAQMTNQ